MLPTIKHFALAFSLLVTANMQGGQENKEADITTLSYCDLIHNANYYNGKIVRVRGAYRVGFEWAELYCSNCAERENKTWIEFADEQCPRSKMIKGDRVVNVIFIGTFQTGNHYGHENGYRHLLVVKCVESAKTVIKTSFVPEKQTQRVAEQTRCQ